MRRRSRLPRTLEERQYGWWVKKRGRLKAMFVWWTIIPLGFTGVGYWGIKTTLVDMPRRYATLQHRGVPAMATFEGCRHHDCRLRLAFRGVTRTWKYDDNHPQFRHLRRGAAVAVIVDPHDVRTTYTANDVKRRTNAGFGVLLVFSSVIGLAGLVGFPYLYLGARDNLREWDRGGYPLGLPSPRQSQLL